MSVVGKFKAFRWYRAKRPV